MVRWLPPPPPPADGELLLGHDVVTLSFFVACIAATVALTSSMCSACGPKAATDPDPAASDQQAGTGSVSGGSQQEGGAEEASEEEVMVRLSPELAIHGAIDPVAMPKSKSMSHRRRLSVSMSKKLSMRIPDKVRLNRRDHKDNHGHKVESEDTLWKKGIILGEKCRIPGEREAECDTPDDPAGGSFRRPVTRSSSFTMYQQHEAPAMHYAKDC